MSRPALWIALLAFASLLFGWQTYKAWTGPIHPEAPSGANAAPVPDSGEVPKAAAPAASPIPVASIAARPLFRPDRRPFQENAAVVLPRRNYEAELNRFTVLGVVRIGESEKAIVTGKTGSREERYEVGPGDALPGFTVREVGPDGVVVAADNQAFTLPLYSGAPKAAPGGALRTEVPKPAVPSASPGQPGAVPFPGTPQPQTAPGVQPTAPTVPQRQGPLPSRRRPPAPSYLPGAR